MALDMDRHVAEFKEQGFSIIPNVVDADMIQRLKAGVEESLKQDWDRYEGLPGKEEFIALDLVQYEGVFWDYLQNPVVDQLFGSILGEAWTIYSFTSTVQRPSGDHYTSKIHNETTRVTPIDFNLSCLLTLALDDFTEENGSTFYLAGSHLTHPEKPSEDEFYSKAIRVSRSAGDGVWFHPRVWHAGGTNTTTDTRSGATVYGCRSFMKPRLDFPRMIGWERGDDLNPNLRRILGYDTRVPVTMDEFYVNPESRLYKGGQG
jgi:ectoine hydroxylase-related dioxygenase (phytanoyl-CoA dioxygenase family)